MFRTHTYLFLLGALLTTPPLAAQELVFQPRVADAAGGAWFRISTNLGYWTDGKIAYFEGVPMEYFPADYWCDDLGENCTYLFEGLFPPQNAPGMVDVDIQILASRYNEEVWYNFPKAFTYVDAPIVDAVVPDNQSIGPDNRELHLHGAGFPIRRAAQVWVGDRLATNVRILDLNGNTSRNYQTPGTKLRCTPPPFPGGAWPLTVDIRVVTVGGGETVLPNAYTYRQIVPKLISLTRKDEGAWRRTSNSTTSLSIENFIESEDVRIFFDDIEVEITCIGSCNTSGRVARVIVPLFQKPGPVDVTVINPDGGTYTAVDAFLYYRRPLFDFVNSYYHHADTDRDHVVSLSELLRVLQFYSAGGLHCDDSTEDGYAPGAEGDQSCIPHDSDLITLDWRVDFYEALEIIQLYNFGAYRLCPNRYEFCLQD